MRDLHGGCFQGVAWLCGLAQPVQVRGSGDPKRQLAEAVRQRVAGVAALDVRPAVVAVVGVDQPVAVEHQKSVYAQVAAVPADLDVAVKLATAPGCKVRSPRCCRPSRSR